MSIFDGFWFGMGKELAKLALGLGLGAVVLLLWLFGGRNGRK